MKFKYYLRGCGLGILFASLILMVAFHTQNKTMDDAAVMERASELGMITSQTQSVDTETDTQQAEAVEHTEMDTQKATENTAPKDAEQDTQKKPENKKNSDSKNKSDRKNEEETKVDSEEITVKIQKGEVCRQIAENLQELGLVEDAETFRKYMQQRGYDDQIRVGTYTLQRGMTQEEIAKVFITK